MTYKKDGQTIEGLDPDFKEKLPVKIHINAAGGWSESSRVLEFRKQGE